MAKIHHSPMAVYVSARNALGRDDYLCGEDGRPINFLPEIEDAISSDFAKSVIQGALVAVAKGETTKR